MSSKAFRASVSFRGGSVELSVRVVIAVPVTLDIILSLSLFSGMNGSKM